MAPHKQARIAFTALFALGLLVLFWGLDTGRIQVWDEGLYGMYGRTMLRYGTLLHVVDAEGQFPTGAVKFSKPPLSVWVVAASMKFFGPSLFALRLPFAIAAFAVALLAYACGRRIESGARGVWLGFVFGLIWLLSYGTYEHGRTATIEPLLLAFVLAALYAYARALDAVDTAAQPSATTGRVWRSLGWAVLSGLAVAGAFFTKQLVCAIAVMPMLAVEVLLGSSARTARIRRLLLALGLPLALAAGWFALLYQRVGSDAQRVLWSHAIVRRVSGFDGVHHQNYLNRVAELLDLDAMPFAWQLGLLGLLLLSLQRLRTPRSGRGAVFLIAGYFACAWLAFDIGSRAILPWYALTLLPPLALGYAFVCVRAVAVLLEPAQPSGRLSGFAAAIGGVAIVSAVGAAARSFMPSVLAITIALAGVMLCLVPPRRLRAPAAEGSAASDARPRPGLVYAWLGALGAALAVGTFARDGYRNTETDPLATLGRALYERDIQKVTVDRRADVHNYALATFFGAQARNMREQPWELEPKAAAKIQARVEPGVWPSEAATRPGVQLLPGAGVFAWIGDLTQRPFAEDALSAALDRGSLTFEAEHMSSDRFYTAASDASASGGRVRRARQRPLERATQFVLAKGTTPEVPRGRYIVSFWLKQRCAGYRGENLGEARVSSDRRLNKKKWLDCRGAAATERDTFSPLELPIQLNENTPLELELRWNQGAVSIDRITLRRDAKRGQKG